MIVRVLTRDDPAQVEAAEAAIRHDFHLTATVLLETDWVLRSGYGWTRELRVAALTALLDLPHAVDYPSQARWALQRTAEGADFADMMHLALAEGASAFVTFDRRLAGQAGSSSPVPVETLR